ncbi:efflux RND transporter permease subunit [Crocinitomix catalasitica]|uniref:efflux RND transporter permease subunit n=1 Tax=Crocinitomix catalasitica TaxID=184607 RepID=UPI0004857E77|nr:MMPL family transporter [Crocinitomix catalasitica]
MKKKAILVCISVVLLSIFFAFKITHLRFDYDFEAFFDPNDAGTQYFNDHRKRFETDNDFVLISLDNSSGVFDQDFLERVDQLSDELEKDSLITGIQSITKMIEFRKTPFSKALFKQPYIDIDSPSTYSDDSLRIISHPEASIFLRKDAKAVLIFVKHAPYLSKNKCDQLKESLFTAINSYGFDDYKLAGRAVGLGIYIDLMMNETLLFVGLSILLVLFVLAFSFRSLWGIIVPLTIVLFSMFWTVGIMAALGQPFNLVLTVLPSIIFVVAMSDVIHLVTKYIDELRLGTSKTNAIKIAYKEIGFATLLTSATTVIGFLSLLTVNMKPIQAFGIYTSIGVVVAFVLAYTLLPALLVLTKAPMISMKDFKENIWYPILHRMYRFVLVKYKLIVIVFIGLIGMAIVGVSKMENNYFLLEDLRPEHQLRKDYNYFDKEFMGLRPVEVSIHVKNPSDSITNYKLLTEINKLSDFLQEDYGLRQTFSIIQALKIANRIEYGGQLKYYKFPDEQSTQSYLTQFKKYDRTGQYNLMIDSSGKYARISSTIGDVGMYEIREKNTRLNQFISAEINTDLIDVQLTGTGHLLDKNMNNLSNKLAQGLLIAVLIVSLIMGFLYRSIKMVLIAIIPNILPLLFLGAIMGYYGIDLKVSTAIIFTISFGIAVDDTIHFMSKLKLELNKGKSFVYALKRTYLSTGRAIIITTLILCSGFLMLIFSDFLGTFYVGLLISLTLFFALLADLLILPALLLLFPLSTQKKEGAVESGFED